MRIGARDRALSASPRGRRIPSRQALLRRREGFVELRVDIGDRLFRLIFNIDERGRKARDLELFRDHQSDRLPRKEDLVVVKRPEGRAWRGSLVTVFFMRRRDVGLLSCANTSITPGTASAALRSILLIRPFAILLETTKPCARPGTLNSAAYFAWPVTLAGPSTRDTGFPMLFVLGRIMQRPMRSLSRTEIAVFQQQPARERARSPAARARS